MLYQMEEDWNFPLTVKAFLRSVKVVPYGRCKDSRTDAAARSAATTARTHLGLQCGPTCPAQADTTALLAVYLDTGSVLVHGRIQIVADFELVCVHGRDLEMSTTHT